MIIRPIEPKDLQSVRDILHNNWGGTKSVSRGKILAADKLDGFVVYIGKKIEGLITLNVVRNKCEIVTLNALIENKGIGTFLIKAAEKYAKKESVENCGLLQLMIIPMQCGFTN